MFILESCLFPAGNQAKGKRICYGHKCPTGKMKSYLLYQPEMKVKGLLNRFE